MMRLHALQRVGEEPATGKVVGLLLGCDGALNLASGPESMAHGAPGVLRVRAKGCGAVLANHQAWRRASKGEVNQAVLIDSRLDGICRAVLVQGQGQIIGADRVHFLVEDVVIQGIRVPNVRGIAIGGEDLGIERDGRVHSPINPIVRPSFTFNSQSSSALTQCCCR